MKLKPNKLLLSTVVFMATSGQAYWVVISAKDPRAMHRFPEGAHQETGHVVSRHNYSLYEKQGENPWKLVRAPT